MRRAAQRPVPVQETGRVKGGRDSVQRIGAIGFRQTSPEYAALMQKSFTSVLYHSPAEYRTILEDENRRWAALLSNPKFEEAMK